MVTKEQCGIGPHNLCAGEIPVRLQCFPSSYALLRFNTLPFHTLSELRHLRTMAYIRERIALEAWFTQRRETLSDLLYEIIPSIADKKARRILLDIRRAIFNNDSPAKRW